MSWFDEQIKLRKLNDEQMFAESFERLAAGVTGRKYEHNAIEQSENAIKDILNYYGYKPKTEVPEKLTDFNEQLQFMCRPFGLMYRRVRLINEWYKDSIGPLLGFTNGENAMPISILPDVIGYKAIIDGKTVKINKQTVKLISENAYCFYKPFPNRKINCLDLLRYSIETRSIKDFALTFIFMGVSTAIGLISPKISYFLYQDVIENKSAALLISTIIFYICVNISTLLFGTYKSMYESIVSSKMSISVQAASMMRVLSLPANFFRKYSSGELSQRMSYLSSLCNTLMSVIFNTCFTSLFSLAYVGSIMEYAPSLVIPSLVIIIVTISFSIISTLVQTRISKENMEISTKESGMSYAMLSGINKIRLSGSEKRAFSRWANLFSKIVNNSYNPPLFIKINGIISTSISTIGNIVMYFFAIKSGVNLAEYSAFSTAYGMVFGAFSSIASITLTFSQVKPIIDMAKPIMDAVPEISDEREILTDINGDIEFNNVSFRYDENMPMIVDNLTLKIKPGQYVAIVGKTGCGKSTLIRLLLGFEKAQKGTIYYDGKDIESIDLKSLRRKIGVVLQDGKLFQGDIFSNITISAPWLTLDDAWAAAEIAGIADDINDMPMGMHTVISEGSGGISGGQRQRLLIARAIAPKPKVLIFDEATSALDNITQKKVSEALDELKCTRIVIAHRLSTIKHCDRILYLEGGKILEDGTYDELIAMNGKFSNLVARQRIDS